MAGRTTTADDIPILTGAEVRQLEERHALVVAENGKPMIAKLDRAIDGKRGRALLQAQTAARQRVEQARSSVVAPEARATAALVGVTATSVGSPGHGNPHRVWIWHFESSFGLGWTRS